MNHASRLFLAKSSGLIESDDTFAYIAGYTSGGAPYGITWEEKKILDTKGDPFSSPLSFDDLDDPDNLPF